MSTIHLFLIVVLIYHSFIVDAVLTPTEIDELRELIINKIDIFSNGLEPASEKPLAAAIIRLTFHDCAGPQNLGAVNNDIRTCDGCIDLDLRDHAGLEKFAINPLEDVLDEFNSPNIRINRADFWAAAGNVALEYTQSLSHKPGILPILPYNFGRHTCSKTPDAVTTSGLDGTEFPLAHLGWDPFFEFFRNLFDMTLKQTAVIIGAHTLGRAHRSASGFNGKWTHTPFHFDNSFFVELFNLDNEWDQDIDDLELNGFPQWQNVGDTSDREKLMMLNSDYALLIMMEEPLDDPHLDPDTGIVTCRVRGFGLYPIDQCKHEISFNTVRDYADDNQLFLDHFAIAWNKILMNNQHDLIEVIPNRFVDKRDRPPTDRPTRRPTARITDSPTGEPTDRPTDSPTDEPTDRPTDSPTDRPTDSPTNRPITRLTDRPTDSPTNRPTDSPTDRPTTRPTDSPTDRPTDSPSFRPTRRPSDSPTDRPTDSPTDRPTDSPTDRPTRRPTDSPTNRPTDSPTDRPTDSPTNRPTDSPTNRPTDSPNDHPTASPTDRPTDSPTSRPTSRPTNVPTKSPTPRPIQTNDSRFCCIANRIPNWNGRCWGATDEIACFNAVPGDGYRCYWDENNCRTPEENLCFLRNIPCTSDDQCCSIRCRPHGVCA